MDVENTKNDQISHLESAPKVISDEPPRFGGLSIEEAKLLERRLVRKIDLHLISSLCLLFIFNILDRSNIANARLGGMQSDLGLSDTQYQTAVAIMFVGYLIGQVPSNIILTRVKPSRYIPIAIFIWGGISMCAAATKNFTGIMVVRVLLGFAESPFFPGALLLVSSWYKPQEIAPRVAVLYCGNTIANGFGGILAAGILSGLDGASGLEGWRWMFIIEGAGTMVAGVLAAANDEVDENGSIKEALVDAFTDPKAWMLIGIQICQLTSQTWTYFFPSIVQTLGFSNIVTLLITVPVYFFGFFTSLGNSFIAQYTNQRASLIVWPLLVDIVGNILVISTHSAAPRYNGMFLMCAGSYSAFNVVQAWIASTVPRTRTKRAIVYAMVNLFGNSSNIYGSYFFPSGDAPQYRMGGIILSSFAAGGCVLVVGLGVWLRRVNQRAGREEALDGRRRYKYLW
ncbi:pantothenate transporter [Aspergillus californicus]